mmetsp:Transcript_27096/g.44737  ORF Transcript_27096/g.44737 Transcript_27096/m.44737 type:complete len:728 (+) Transcript_27096:7-2190(+)
MNVMAGLNLSSFLRFLSFQETSGRMIRQVFSMYFSAFLLLITGSTAQEVTRHSKSFLRSKNIYHSDDRHLNPVEEDVFIFQAYDDGFVTGSGDKVGTACSTNTNYVSFIQDAVEGDYINIVTNKWHSGGYRMDCAAKNSNYQCIATCSPFPNPNFRDWHYLTFEVKLPREGDCAPSVSLLKRWPMYSSNVITLEGDYVDGGALSQETWTRVVIPTEDFATAEWPNVDGVKDIYFRNCASSSNPQYQIRGLALTNTMPIMETPPPTGTPTSAPTAKLSSATHRFVHTNWYPILDSEREPEGNSWVTIVDNTWPSITAPDRTVSVHIPRGQTVSYSASDSVKYDKIIVEGSLSITSLGSDVSLTVSTIVVEEGGSLEVLSDPNDHDSKILIEIEGALDSTVDPEQTMVGILALGGNLTIVGNSVARKMVTLHSAATSGSTQMEVSGDVTDIFRPGDELILPDTQSGLDVLHWNFVNSGTYVDQTESCIIESIQLGAESGNTNIMCSRAFVYEHGPGFHAGYVSRSIVVRTSASSTDRGHIMHTSGGKFEIRNVRIDNLGRTTTDMIDSTVMAVSPGYTFSDLDPVARMEVSHHGVNQIARYALHAHHSTVEAYFTGNALLDSPRDGCVAHNSRVYIQDNVIVGAAGTGVFLEDGTETGPVTDNFIIGRGRGSRGHDDGRFAIQSGQDMAHGGFGIWARGKLALIQRNHAEGHFGVAPFAFFVHCPSQVC